MERRLPLPTPNFPGFPSGLPAVSPVFAPLAASLGAGHPRLRIGPAGVGLRRRQQQKGQQ